MKYRILLVTGNATGVWGGGQVYSHGLREALAAAGHQVSETAGVSSIRPGCADIVHAHAGKSAACRAAAGAGIPCVTTMHHGGLVCPQGALLDWEDRICRRPVDLETCTRCCLRGRWWGNVPAAFGRLLRRLPNIPFITPAATRRLTVLEKQSEIAELARHAAMFVAPSKAAQEALARNSIPFDRIAVVPHGIAPLERRPLPAAPAVRFAYVGRITREKGLHVLLDAFSRVRGDAELHVLGAAHSKWDRRYLARLGRPDRVFLHGHLDRASLADAWSRCVVTVLPTICMEVFGLVVQESFTLGRPVIVTDCGGPAEQVRNGLDGLVVPPDHPAALAEAMQRFTDNPSLVADMAQNLPAARTMEQHVSDLERVYTQCISRGPS